MMDGEIQPLYSRWFQGPIPPKGVTLEVPMSALMRDQVRFPSDKVGDDIGG
jgi:glutamate/aspartate transport system substrate-binding protein